MRHMTLSISCTKLSMMSFLVGTCLASVSQVQLASSQEAIDWSSLGALQLLDEYRRNQQSLDEAQKAAAQQRAAELMVDRTADETYSTLNQLYQIALPELSADQKATLSARLKTAGGTATERGFKEFMHWRNLSRWAQGNNSHQQEQDGAAMVASWIDSHGQDDLQESLYQLTWLMKNLNLSPLAQASSLQNFSVTWTGFLTPPSSGEYTFSPSEFDITTIERSYSIKQSMSVSIDGQQVVDATPEAWLQPEIKISLTAGSRVPIRVEYRYETTTGKFDTVKTPLAMLFWEGPGISKTIVPASVYTQPNGKDSGLQAQYLVQLADQIITDTVTEPNIEHLWFSGLNFLCHHSDAQSRIADELWRRTMSAAYWANPAEPDVGNEPLAGLHLFVRVPSIASFLNCAQRGAFLQKLQTYPQQLEQMTLRQATDVFKSFQFGAEEAAITFLGSFTQKHDINAQPVLTKDFYQDNRERYRLLTITLVWQRPAYAETLENEYLELEDGSCCLSVAYIVAYGKLQQGEIKEWIAFLDEKLADESLAGDRRVNWLLARAHAEEIYLCPPERHFTGDERILAGLDWLNEAILVSETEPKMLQAFREKVSRLAARAIWDRARELVDTAQESLHETTSLAETNAWKAAVDRLIDQRADELARWNEEILAASQRITERREQKASSQQP